MRLVILYISALLNYLHYLPYRTAHGLTRTEQRISMADKYPSHVSMNPYQLHPIAAAAARRLGFTLVELLAILILLGILSVAVLRVATRSNAPVIAAADQLASHMRHVQARALADVESWQLELTGTTQYRIPDSGGGFELVELRDGVSFAASLNMRFDQWGRPVDGADNVLNAVVRVTLSDGVHSRTVEVLPQTGFVRVL